jgi:heme/copper-type cytochrome/quinol oxidase subunit 2
MMMTSLTLFGCATCLPDPNSAEANAQGFAILVMLGILAFVFGIIFLCIASFVKRQRQFAVAQGLAS